MTPSTKNAVDRLAAGYARAAKALLIAVGLTVTGFAASPALAQDGPASTDRVCFAVSRAIFDIDDLGTPGLTTVRGVAAQRFASQLADHLGYPVLDADFALVRRLGDELDVRLVARDACIVARITVDAADWPTLAPRASTAPLDVITRDVAVPDKAAQDAMSGRG